MCRSSWYDSISCPDIHLFAVQGDHSFLRFSSKVFRLKTSETETPEQNIKKNFSGRKQWQQHQQQQLDLQQLQL